MGVAARDHGGRPRKTLTIAALLLLVFGLGWWFKARTARLPAAWNRGHAAALEVQLKKLTVQRLGDHAHLTLSAEFRAPSPVRLEPPLVSLLTARQTPAPRFIGPMLPEPLLKGSGPAELALHYWLPVADLQGPLLLEAAGNRYPLTSPQPLPDLPEGRWVELPLP